MSKIHSSSIIHPNAVIGEGCEIGPFVVIEKDVVLGKNCLVAPHAVIKEYVTMGDNNKVGESALIGGKPQDVKFTDAKTFVKIGNNNTFREFVTIHVGTEEGTATTIGDNNFLMGYVHIAHNCHLGNNIVIANYTAFSGHVDIDDFAFISGGTLVHQFVRIGQSVMVGGGTKLRMDALPFFMINGDPPGLFGLNLVGLRRRGFSRDQISVLKEANRILFYSGHLIDDAVNKLKTLEDKNVDHIVEFIQGSKRGFHHPLKGRKKKYLASQEREESDEK
jgi:UDP-N-acetylglucosamine acyltransferase